MERISKSFMAFEKMRREDIPILFQKLSQSKFRSRFHLNAKVKKYLESKGRDVIASHAYEFIQKRLAPKDLANDGKQTPFHGHPVFVAQHATATCCRSCLYKWHHIPPHKDLSENEIQYIVEVILTWLDQEETK